MSAGDVAVGQLLLECAHCLVRDLGVMEVQISELGHVFEEIEISVPNQAVGQSL